jgi:Holliday junction DNA helicase RuvA
MIDILQGVVASVTEQRLTVLVHGVGYSVAVPNTTQYHMKQDVNLFIYMHWNQEQGPSLYGFTSEAERTVFAMILDCSGIGPKIALAVLADLGPERFVAAVHAGDEKELSSVSGIGAKKAEQMIVQLRHKVTKLMKSGIQLGQTGANLAQWQEIVQVLESLNYSKPEIADTMKHLRDTYAGQQHSFDQLVRHALSFLAKKA